jgi:putative redox protein
MGPAARRRCPPLPHPGVQLKLVTITWQRELDRFEARGTHRGHQVAVNAPHASGPPTGFSASELLLAAAGSCSAWDVVEILRKKRQQVSGVDVEVAGEQGREPPWPFLRVRLLYRLRGRDLSRRAAERAVRLSVERYCSVVATIRGVAEVSTDVELQEDGSGVPTP